MWTDVGKGEEGIGEERVGGEKWRKTKTEERSREQEEEKRQKESQIQTLLMRTAVNKYNWVRKSQLWRFIAYI